jgi:antitoxin (DNA-binding transcriptional repressor) of toxin-antitoxin stability system
MVLMRKVNLQYARTHLNRLVDDALAGEEVVIAKEDNLLVRLEPVASARKRRFGLDAGKIVIRDDFDDPMPELERSFYGDPSPSA